MKLFRFGAPGAEKPGMLLPDGARVDASGFGADWNEAFFALGDEGFGELARWVGAGRRQGAARSRRASASRPAVARPSKLVCIGLNYRDHARESGAALPGEPIVFLKASQRARRARRTICACRSAATRPTGRSSWRW